MGFPFLPVDADRREDGEPPDDDTVIVVTAFDSSVQTSGRKVGA